jgi:heme exporter protein D
MIALPALGLAMWLKFAATAAVVGVLVTSCVIRDKKIATEAVQQDRAKTEKANVETVKKAARAAERSRDPGVRGVVDPSTRRD